MWERLGFWNEREGGGGRGILGGLGLGWGDCDLRLVF